MYPWDTHTHQSSFWNATNVLELHPNIPGPLLFENKNEPADYTAAVCNLTGTPVHVRTRLSTRPQILPATSLVPRPHPPKSELAIIKGRDQRCGLRRGYVIRLPCRRWLGSVYIYASGLLSSGVWPRGREQPGEVMVSDKHEENKYKKDEAIK